MIKKTASLTAWIFLSQLILYFVHQYANFQLSTAYELVASSPLHPPKIIFPVIWSTLYVMITIAGWLLWQERRKQDVKSALWYYLTLMIMSWAWVPIFFKLHWMGFAFFWTIGILVATFVTIIKVSEKVEFAATLLTPYFLWLLYLAYLCIDVWLGGVV